MVKDITVDNSLRTILKGPGNDAGGGDAKGPGFAEMLKETVSEVNGLQKEADTAAKELLKGNASIHDTMIAIEKADLSFRYMMKIRNKIVESYQEIMRMQV